MPEHHRHSTSVLHRQTTACGCLTHTRPLPLWKRGRSYPQGGTLFSTSARGPIAAVCRPGTPRLGPGSLPLLVPRPSATGQCALLSPVRPRLRHTQHTAVVHPGRDEGQLGVLRLQPGDSAVCPRQFGRPPGPCGPKGRRSDAEERQLPVAHSLLSSASRHAPTTRDSCPALAGASVTQYTVDRENRTHSQL